MAKVKGTDFASAVLEVMKPGSNTPAVKQRLRMSTVHEMTYELNCDPGLVKPIAHFVLVPSTYTYEVGPLTLVHEQPHT